jgi:hypothetical protein
MPGPWAFGPSFSTASVAALMKAERLGSSSDRASEKILATAMTVTQAMVDAELTRLMVRDHDGSRWPYSPLHISLVRSKFTKKCLRRGIFEEWLAVRRCGVFLACSIFRRFAATRAVIAAGLEADGFATAQAIGRLALAFDEGEKRGFIRVGVQIVVAEIVLVVHGCTVGHYGRTARNADGWVGST